MSNITVNTDCLETVIEMINRCAADLDSDVSTLLDTSFTPLVNAGLCGNIAGTLKSQCQTLDRKLGGCSIRIANFLTDYVIGEKELEAYCNSLTQETNSLESILNTESFGFTTTSDATEIDSVNKGLSISSDDNTNNQTININTENLKETVLNSIDNENQLTTQQMNDNYKIESEQLENINNANETIEQTARLLEGNNITKPNISSMTNDSSLTIKKFAEYLKTQELTHRISDSNVDRRV